MYLCTSCEWLPEFGNKIWWLKFLRSFSRLDSEIEFNRNSYICRNVTATCEVIVLESKACVIISPGNQVSFSFGLWCFQVTLKNTLFSIPQHHYERWFCQLCDSFFSVQFTLSTQLIKESHLIWNQPLKSDALNKTSYKWILWTHLQMKEMYRNWKREIRIIPWEFVKGLKYAYFAFFSQHTSAR